MQNQYTAEGLIQQIRNSREEIHERLDEFDVALDDLADTVGENEEGEAALEAQPALLDTLREAEHGLSVALAHLKAHAPSPRPSGWHMQEPQWAIGNALDRVSRQLDEHLA